MTQHSSLARIKRRSPVSRVTLYAAVAAMVTAACAAVLPATTARASSLVVNTQYGPVKGTATAANRSFLGIPYAAPPVGNLRWRPPQPPKPWTSPRDSTQFGPTCEQPLVAGISLPGTMSQDCLYLNVYAPASGANLPVMVWIHGGGWFSGAGRMYDGSQLAAQHNVIVVTINYRLGPEGYLALPGLAAENPYNSTGNYGLQDQEAALRWVQANIAGFGGNARNVTISGESAGSGSVCALLASPQAAGLFQRAIMESWSCTSPGNTMALVDAEARSNALAAKVGCASASPATVVACMRSVPAAKLVSTFTPSQSGLLTFGQNLLLQTVDGHYLPETTATAIATGNFHRVPVLAGTNASEGNLIPLTDYDMTGIPLNNGNYYQRLQEFLASWLPIGSRLTAAVLYALYPPWIYPAPGYNPSVAQAHLAMGALFTDFLLSCTQQQADDALAPRVPTYTYQFADPSPPYFLPSPDFPLGPAHSTELAYVFGGQVGGGLPYQGMTAQQVTLSQQMQSYWTNFARTGNPNGPGLPNWPQYRPLLGGQMLTLAPGALRTTNEVAFGLQHKCVFWNPINIISPALLVLLELPK